MKKKMFFLMAMIAVIFMMLTGCVSQKVNVKINSQNGGRISTVLLIEESVYSMMAGMGGSEISQNPVLQGMTKGEETIDETKYISFTETKEYKTYGDMEKALLEIEYPDMEDESGPSGMIFKTAEIKKSGGLITSAYNVKLVTNAQEINTEPDYVNDSEDGYISFDSGFDNAFKLYVEIEMPGKITGYKSGEVNGSVLRSDITSLSEENEITVTSETTNLTFIIIGILICLIILALFILIARRK